jgi:hypothetical protein
VKKTLLSSLAIIVLASGCANKPPPSNYVEIKLSQSGMATKNTWQICYGGAFADHDILTGHLSGEYVANVLPGFPGFKRKTTIIENTNNGTLVIKNSKNNATVASFSRSAFKDKDIYIIMDSNTTGGWIIPLPFLVAHKLDGNRTVTPVDKDAFDKYCGNTSGTVFIKPN